MLLEEGWGYFAGVGGSCSTHNLRPVDPHPRGVGRPEAGRASADVEPPPGGCAGTRRQPERARSEVRPAEGGAGPWGEAPGPTYASRSATSCASPWGEGARRHQGLARPRGVEHVSSSVSTVLTSTVPPSERPAESLEFQGSVSARDTGAGLMSAPWTQASHQATVNDPLLREPRP